jgi:hypothetical protein
MVPKHPEFGEQALIFIEDRLPIIHLNHVHPESQLTNSRRPNNPANTQQPSISEANCTSEQKEQLTTRP